MYHDPTGRSPEELAALFIQGAMTDAEHDEYQRHLESGCAECLQEVRKINELIGRLLGTIAPVEPSPATKSQLLERIRQSQKRSAEPSPLQPHLKRPESGPEFVTLRSNEIEWEETAVPGVFIKTLHVDTATDQFTAVVRMESGSRYPKHRHSGPEHCFVIEGDLRVGEHVLNAGDYEVAEPGSHHGVQTTQGGCLLLIRSSLSDEFE